MIRRAYIEILNTCNLSCAFCQTNTRPPQRMSVTDFCHVLDEVRTVTDYVYLHVQGEPLLHPEFDEIMNVCDLAGVHVQLVTNGTFLPSHPDLIRHPSLHRLSISLQSIEYQTIDTDAYIRGIIDLLTSLPEHPSFITDLRFWRTDQITLAKTSRMLDAIRCRYTPVPSGRDNQYRIAERVYVSFDNSFEWPEEQKMTAVPVRGTCLGARDQIAVLTDGTVVPCCLDADAHIPLGNIFETSLKDILQSARCTSLVKGFENRTVVEPFCAGCTFRKRFDRTSEKDKPGAV
ncbi:MAG: radical SAM protein [Solobacterium sp.]|nr:radical SAM protein [Solobacterium sp.]